MIYLLVLAKDEGYELSEEELEDVSGGRKWGCDNNTCNELAHCTADWG